MKVWYVTGETIEPHRAILIKGGRYRWLDSPRPTWHRIGPQALTLTEHEEGIVETDDLAAVAAAATVLGVEE